MDVLFIIFLYIPADNSQNSHDSVKSLGKEHWLSTNHYLHRFCVVPTDLGGEVSGEWHTDWWSAPGRSAETDGSPDGIRERNRTATQPLHQAMRAGA